MYENLRKSVKRGMAQCAATRALSSEPVAATYQCNAEFRVPYNRHYLPSLGCCSEPVAAASVRPPEYCLQVSPSLGSNKGSAVKVLSTLLSEPVAA